LLMCSSLPSFFLLLQQVEVLLLASFSDSLLLFFACSDQCSYEKAITCARERAAHGIARETATGPGTGINEIHNLLEHDTSFIRIIASLIILKLMLQRCNLENFNFCFCFSLVISSSDLFFSFSQTSARTKKRSKKRSNARANERHDPVLVQVDVHLSRGLSQSVALLEDSGSHQVSIQEQRVRRGYLRRRSSYECMHP
jgi:hypothetical protein